MIWNRLSESAASTDLCSKGNYINNGGEKFVKLQRKARNIGQMEPFSIYRIYDPDLTLKLMVRMPRLYFPLICTYWTGSQLPQSFIGNFIFSDFSC